MTATRRVTLALALVLVAVSCASVQPGADPIVVRAEQTWRIGFETVDGFLFVESQGMLPFLKTESVKAFVAKLTAPNPDGKLMASGRPVPYGKWVFDRLDSAIVAYKANRTPEKQADISTYLSLAESLISTAQSHLKGR